IGGARIDFASPAELEAAGFDTRPMWVLPDRVWSAMSTRIADGTRLNQAGSPTQAGVIGGARIDFASPAELEAAGFDTRPMWVLPDRVWNGMSTTIADGTLIRTPVATTVWKIVNGRRVVTTETGTVWIVAQRVADAIPLG
ncbi:hypothetical protein ACH4TV_46305, partial [Streptomyces sp. NPDC020898]|uniref:hypothetical protein n=1 Tax=Streptomyces sp. NPDC020898 TaxID=3365101 RepID=UPI00378AD517